MRKSESTKTQIIGIMGEAEAGVKVQDGPQTVDSPEDRPGLSEWASWGHGGRPLARSIAPRLKMPKSTVRSDRSPYDSGRDQGTDIANCGRNDVVDYPELPETDHTLPSIHTDSSDQQVPSAGVAEYREGHDVIQCEKECGSLASAQFVAAWCHHQCTCQPVTKNESNHRRYCEHEFQPWGGFTERGPRRRASHSKN